jgi:hypothetical protein
MISIEAVDWQFLSVIATAYTTVKSEGGRPCLVLPAPLGARYLGEAAKWGGGRAWSIRLRLDQTPDELTTVFFHELAHLISENPPRRADGDTDGITFSNVDSVADADFRARVRAHLVMIEADADKVGAELRRDFEARHGPLSALALR